MARWPKTKISGNSDVIYTHKMKIVYYYYFVPSAHSLSPAHCFACVNIFSEKREKNKCVKKLMVLLLIATTFGFIKLFFCSSHHHRRHPFTRCARAHTQRANISEQLVNFTWWTLHIRFSQFIITSQITIFHSVLFNVSFRLRFAFTAHSLAQGVEKSILLNKRQHFFRSTLIRKQKTKTMWRRIKKKKNLINFKAISKELRWRWCTVAPFWRWRTKETKSNKCFFFRFFSLRFSHIFAPLFRYAFVRYWLTW